MAVKLTDKQILLISSLAYIDIDVFYSKNNLGEPIRKTLGGFSEDAKKYIIAENKKIEFNGGYTHEEFLDIVDEIAKDPTLKDLRIADYLNDNKQSKEDAEFTGFVGLALKDAEGNSIIVSRGSEGANQQEMEGAASPYMSQDWIDNYKFAGRGSEQFPLMIDFVERNRSDNRKPTFVTGHSKGAANALYAAGVLDNVTGAVYDGPGITQLLTPEQIRRLRTSGIKNYVAEGDVVGALLFHEEEVIYVKTSSYTEKNGKQEYIRCYRSNSPKDQGFDLTLDLNNFKDCFHFHQLQAIAFDENDTIIKSKQGFWSYAATLASQKFYCENLERFDPVGRLLDGYEVVKDGGILIDNLKNVWLSHDRKKWEGNTKKAFGELWKSCSHLGDYNYFKKRLADFMGFDEIDSNLEALSEDTIFLTCFKSMLVRKRAFHYLPSVGIGQQPSFEEMVVYAKLASCIEEKVQDWIVEGKDKISAFREKMERESKEILADFMEYQLQTVFDNKEKEGFEYIRSFFHMKDMPFENFKRVWMRKALKKKLLSSALNYPKWEKKINANILKMVNIHQAEMKLKGIVYRFALDKKFGFTPSLFVSSKYVVWVSEQKETSCDVCKERNGKIYVKDKVKNEFPIHPHCGCELLPLVSIRKGTATKTGTHGLDTNYPNDRKWGIYQNVRAVLPEMENRTWKKVKINETGGHTLFRSNDGLQFVTYDNCDTFYAVE